MSSQHISGTSPLRGTPTRTHRRLLAATLVAWVLLGEAGMAGAAGAGEDSWPSAPLTVQGNTFRDAHGRQVILSGVNLVDKQPKDGFNAAKGPEVFAQLRAWGFNCVRLGIVWAGVEPQPGKYDEAYLKQVDQAIQWASRQGIYVILDMHQDLYSMKYSDGAAEWATLDEGKPHATGAIWSDAYLLSPAVQTAFDNFWANKPASDGKGVQDHYAAMWQHLARRYANQTGVVGYDLMNEPFPGSSGAQFIQMLLTGYAKVAAAKTGKAPSPVELMLMWADEKSRLKALELIASGEAYARVIDEAQPLNEAFETGPLQAFHQRVANAIREVDPRHVLFLEHSYFSNPGVRSAIRSVTTKAGARDPQVAYAPHGYDLVTDTKAVAGASYERVRVILSRIHETGQKIGMPIVLDEWGAFPGADPALVAPARQVVGLLEEFQMGNTYWHYDSQMGKFPYFREALLRPYPVCVAGELKRYRFDREKNELEVVWQESPCDGLPTVIFLPDMARVKKQGITSEPKAAKMGLRKMAGAPGGYLLIYPEASQPSRKLVVPFTSEGPSARK